MVSIGDWAFNGCSKLTVFYKGTIEEWKKISINNYLNLDEILYYYSENKPTDDGNYWHYDTDGVTPVIW